MDTMNPNFHRNGFSITRNLFSEKECHETRAAFHEMNRLRNYPEVNDAGYVKPFAKGDPLAAYPRIMQPHRWHHPTMNHLLDKRLQSEVESIFSEAALATETVFYFHPPRASGLAYHQDDIYVNVQPGYSIKAYLALDKMDESNGTLKIISGSHQWPLLHHEKIQSDGFSTTIRAVLPVTYEEITINLDPGDVFFFHGHLIHGSFPNHASSFRRALVSTYIPLSTEKIAEYLFPVYLFDGREKQLTPAKSKQVRHIPVTLNGKLIFKPAHNKEKS